MPDARIDPALLRIQDVADETGLTTRAIRYYEEVGLLEPAARSEGAYRLYDASDLERLRYIKTMRDDAGFSLAQIGELLEDEGARERNRERFRAAADPADRRAILLESLERIDRQVALLDDKASRLAAMIEAARARRAHLERHLADIDTKAGPTAEGPTAAASRSAGAASSREVDR